MRITRLRNLDGSKLESPQVELLISKLSHSIERAGFISDVSKVNSSSVKIGLHMACFRIDTNKHGYNARVNDITITSCKAGYKRTDSPTWRQREEFNHIVNNVMDQLRMRGNITSGTYSIRRYQSGRVNFWAMPDVFNNGYRLQVPSVLEIVPIKYAAEAVEWVGINAPFVAVVPDMKPKYIRVAPKAFDGVPNV